MDHFWDTLYSVKRNTYLQQAHLLKNQMISSRVITVDTALQTHT